MSKLDIETVKNMSPNDIGVLIDGGNVSPDELQLLDVQLSEWKDTVSNHELAKALASATIDAVTGLHATSGFMPIYDYIRRSAEIRHRTNPARKPIFATILDVEALGNINVFGQGLVDESVLRPFAQVIKKTARKSDAVGRIGGDEFVVAGVASTNETGTICKAANRFAHQTLGRLLLEPSFMSFDAIGSMGVLAKSMQFTEELDWPDVKRLVDPKIGMEKGAYDYTKLPEGATLQRIYRTDDNPWGSYGHLTTTNEGGFFVAFDTVRDMGTELRHRDYSPAVAGVVRYELEAKDVPRPYHS